jgi:ribosomal protein S18 acetylase RimI-like enzyme
MPAITPEITIRPLDRGDRRELADAFARLSEDSRRRRFGALAKRLGDRDLDRLTQLDHHGHEALAAVAPDTGRILGVARYIVMPDDPGAAEVAVAVDDHWQGQGIGRRLIAGLAERARAEGITRMVAQVATDNVRVIDWVRRSGGVVTARDGDAVLMAVRLA